MELDWRGLFAFVEPLPQERVDGKYKVNASVPRRVRAGDAFAQSTQKEGRAFDALAHWIK